MSEQFIPTRGARRDSGFTLIEILISITLTGLLATTLAAAITVTLRTVPDSEQRIADARSLKGLVTWLPQDIDAAPPDGFSVADGAWSCSGPAPIDSHNVLALMWVENGASTATFNASYRYDYSGGEWRMVRYSCENGGAAARVNMTSELAAWNITTPPARVEMCSAALDSATGLCPAGSVVTDPTVEPVESLKMTLTLLDGTPYTIDAAAKNPDEDLRDDPDAVTNFAPAAASSSYNHTMLAGDTVVLDLYATHGISDPESDELTSARDSYEPMPAGITVTASDPLQVTVVADSSLTAGVLADPIPLVVSDAFGGSVEITVTIEIVEPPNDPPVAAIGPTYTLTIGQGETMIIPLDLTHGIYDPNDDAIILEVSDWPAPLALKPSVGAPLGELQMLVTAKAGAALGPVALPVVTRVFDEHGLYIDVTTYLEIVPATINNPPTVSIAARGVSMEAGDSIALAIDALLGAADPDLDVIWVEVDTSLTMPAGLNVTTTGLDVTIDADPSMTDGVAGSVPLLIYDWHGATRSVTVTVEIVPPPPPPSNCVLGGLSASQNPVDRSGTGAGPRALGQDVLVTLTYSGNCDGLVLKYDTGHPSGLGAGVGRVFPLGSPTSVVLVGYDSGGTEKWVTGTPVLTASTTSDVSPDSVALTLTVN